MIKTFADKQTAAVFKGEQVRRLPANIQPRARTKLMLIDAANALDDLRIPPGNRLEALSGERKEQHSVRINDQWRICFRWADGHTYEVEICDYHR